MRRLWLLAALAAWGCEEAPPPGATVGAGGEVPPPGTTPDAGAQAPPDGPAPGGCATDAEFFEHRVWRPVMQTTCAACHRAGGVAEDTRLRLVGPEVDGWIAANLASLRPLALSTVRDVPLIVAKPAGLHPDGHGGGTLFGRGSTGYVALAALAGRLDGSAAPCEPVAGMVPDDPACETAPPGVRGLRRLSHLEYANTMRDLLGLEVSDLSPDRVVHGFDNNGAALTVTPLLADQYRAEAERLAEAVDLARVLPCGATDRACAVTFVRDFGRRLMRRPLTADEQAGYLRIYDLAAEVGFEAGIRWTLTAMLQSPHFLYRTELGRRTDAGFTLTSYEVATELSYLFWQTTPDARLLDLAADGSLLDATVVAAEVPRLLDDPRSAATMNRFAERWLGLDRLPQVTRDGELYPHLTDALRAEMAEETRRTIAAAWRDGATLAVLLRGSSRPMTATLAAYYGVPPPGDQWVATNLDDTPYAGLLTHGSVLVTHALPTGSSPIHRGLFVRERLLCQDLPDPPANLDTSPPPVDPTLSTRERYSQHATDDACSGCHRQIDPIGFTFEHFDADGRWRPTDGAHPIDATGALTGTAASDAAFDGVAELADVLADSSDVAACYVTQWLRYGYGVDDTLPIACYVGQLAPQVDALSDVLPALASLPHMMRRTGGDAELDVPGADLTPLAPGEVVEPPDPADPPDVVDPPPPPPPMDDVTPGATLRLVEQSRWPTGYCVDAFVLNEGEGELRWAVAHDVEGRINNVWNATGTADSGRVVFRGADWNGTLVPGQEAQFGWCAEL